jgi:choline dehydrogenase
MDGDTHVVIVGGGTSGAVLAARLSEDPDRNVLLLEAGPDEASYPDTVRTPAREYEAIMSSALGVQWSVPIGAATAPTLIYRGEVLGGTSAVNFMAAVRGQPADYDRWDELGCEGWGWDQVLPAFRSAETDLDLGHRPLHGSDGPLTLGRWPESTWSAFHRALYDGAIELGAAASPDINDPDTLPAIGVFPGSTKPSTGERLTVSQAYLTDEVRQRPNLELRCDAPVARVSMDAMTATGVILRSGEVATADEVVLCAGAIESPKLLLLSGIGPSEDLEALGIDSLLDLRGVGSNLQDHVGLGCMYHLPDHEDLVGSPAKTVWVGDSGAGRGVDFHILICPISSTPEGGTLAQLFAFHLLPRARGTLRLSSAEPEAIPALDLPLLTNDEDLDDLSRVVTLVAEWERTEAYESLGASRISPDGALSDASDRAVLLGLLDRSTFSYFHQIGTCRMGAADDDGAVVDPTLAVRGTSGLRVADASVMPTIVRGNTYLGCVMVAERLARLMDR